MNRGQKRSDCGGLRLDLAFYHRDLDAAGSLAAAIPQKNERDFYLGIVARLKGDVTAARAAFIKAAQPEEELRVDPDNMDLLFRLGQIDALLGKKEEALSEGRRAMELVPTAQEAMIGRCKNEGFATTRLP